MPFNVSSSSTEKHPLTDIGLKKFLDDWAKLRQKKSSRDAGSERRRP